MAHECMKSRSHALERSLLGDHLEAGEEADGTQLREGWVLFIRRSSSHVADTCQGKLYIRISRMYHRGEE